MYLAYLKSPYYKFFRDTLSYIIMLLLHYAICLSPTTVAFSGLEWTILVFYIGRFVVEFKQILCIKKWLRETENDTRQSNCVRIFSVYCRYRKGLNESLLLTLIKIFIIWLGKPTSGALIRKKAINAIKHSDCNSLWVKLLEKVSNSAKQTMKQIITFLK